jgi:3-phenylpropionate/cinnamic acid dioxygenase small subunit
VNALATESIAISEGAHREVAEFLFREASLLDAGQFKEWLGLLADDMHYRLVTPNLSQAKPGARLPEAQTVLLDETYSSFKARVQQLSTPAFTLAENPRPFTRRFITNILLNWGAAAGSIEARYNTLVFRSRGGQMEPHLFSMGRRDILLNIGGQLRVTSREAQLDESIVTARNITALW